MKIVKIAFCMLFISIVALGQQEKDYSLAKVGKKVLGIYIFIGCEPNNEYDYIATIDVRWHEGDPDKSFLELIERGKKKYTNFNAIIFKDAKFETADLIKFKDLEISGGGYRVGEYVIHKDGSELNYGEISMLNNIKSKATIKYLDEYGVEKIKDVKYTKLSSLSKEEYQKNYDAQLIEIQKHKFTISEKATWVEDEKSCYGEVLSLNENYHEAKVNYIDIYGETKTKNINYLKLEKAIETKYNDYILQHAIDVEKHKFIIGETVSFTDDKVVKVGEVTALNNNNHIATVKLLNIFGEEKTNDIPYLELEKISKEKFKEEVDKYKIEIAKYKFKIGEQVNWSKGGVFKKSEIIQCEIISLDDISHKALVKYIDKENIEKQEKAGYLDLSKTNSN